MKLILNILFSACIKLPGNLRCETPRPSTPEPMDFSPDLSDIPSSLPAGSQGAKSTAVSSILLLAYGDCYEDYFHMSTLASIIFSNILQILGKGYSGKRS